MQLAFHFTRDGNGSWCTDEEKETHSGTVDVMLNSIPIDSISSIRFYCEPANALPYLKINQCKPNIPYRAFAPVLTSGDRFIKLKSLFAVHSSAALHNKQCSTPRDDPTTWWLALTDEIDETIELRMERHITYPLASFPYKVNLVATGKLLGHILSPVRFLDPDDTKGQWTRLTQWLDINSVSAHRYGEGKLIDDVTKLSYRSWGIGAQLSKEELKRPDAFLHRIALYSKNGVVNATKTWIRMLVSYWHHVTIDTTLNNKAGFFVQREAEKQALQRHFNSIIARQCETL